MGGVADKYELCPLVLQTPMLFTFFFYYFLGKCSPIHSGGQVLIFGGINITFWVELSLWGALCAPPLCVKSTKKPWHRSDPPPPLSVTATPPLENFRKWVQYFFDPLL